MRTFERRSSPVLIRFRDGEVYNLRIVSTLHAEEGDDVAAEVVAVEPTGTAFRFPAGAFMNFKLEDVTSVDSDGLRLFG